MKKQRLRYRILCLILVVFTAAALVCSCSRAPAKGDYDNVGNSAGGDKYYVESGSTSDSEGGIGNVPTAGLEDPNAKIIKTAYATLRTEEYDKTVEQIYNKISELEGYVDDESYNGSSPYRSAYVTIRVPSGRLDELRTHLSSVATLTSYRAKKDDVTVAYDVLVAKIDTLELEVGVVKELFDVAKADGNLERIAELEARLSELQLQLAEAKAILASYDNDIAYSTVYLTVNETKVKVIENEEKEGVFSRIGKNLKTNLADIGNFFVELFIFIISAIPYLLILGGLTVGAIFIIIRLRKKRAANKKNGEEKNKDDKK